MQPPLGGCVLKHWLELRGFTRIKQPPLGGCVLKPYLFSLLCGYDDQPPLGGCVLKRRNGSLDFQGRLSRL